MRTWDDNRSAINQLWPVATFTEEEKKLWSDDLSRLDQVTLYDAIRNAKRTHDSVYPQLKWVLDDYRGLYTTKIRALRPSKSKDEKLLLKIDPEKDRATTEEMMAMVDESGPHDFQVVEATVLDNLSRMNAVSAVRVLNYARERLLGQRPLFGRVTESGEIQPITVGGTTP